MGRRIIMKNFVIYTLISFGLLSFSDTIDAQCKSICFKIQSSQQGNVIPVERTFSYGKKDYMLRIFEGIEVAYGLSVSMDVVRQSEDFLVRILLEDNKGKNHLVAESYKEIAPAEESIQLVDFCEETALLEGIKPICMHIILNNAEVTLHSVKVLSECNRELSPHSEEFQKRVNSIRKEQVQAKVDQINTFITANNKLWKAGITGLSLMSHEEKMRILGCPLGGNTYGIEYYSGGIIDIGILDTTLSEQRTSSQYIDYFDWRERHGKNWTTPVKDQGHSGYCSAFSAVSCTEALVNLYLNNIVSLDLSEQEAASCNNHTVGSSINFYKYGMPIISPLKYIRDVGVCDESSYPFVDDSLARFCHSDQIIPHDIVAIDSISSNLKYPLPTNEERIKEALIKNGPLSSGIYATDGPNHAMALIGYGTVKEGDIVQRIWNYSGSNTGLTDTLHIASGNPLIGRNYWIFKNSYLNGGTINPPYMLVVMDLKSSISDTYALYTPHWRRRTLNGNYELVNDIICEDSDGDGYFFWGLGPKPASCPSWVPDEPDGDDSDYTKGPMDEYGWLLDLNPDNNDTLYIDTDTIWNTYRYQHRHVCIRNNATLSVSDTVRCYQGVSFSIQANATLRVKGGTMVDADIKAQTGSNVKIQNNGRIIPRTNRDFYIPIGAKMQINYGRIK